MSNVARAEHASQTSTAASPKRCATRVAATGWRPQRESQGSAYLSKQRRLRQSQVRPRPPVIRRGPSRARTHRPGNSTRRLPPRSGDRSRPRLVRAAVRLRLGPLRQERPANRRVPGRVAGATALGRARAVSTVRVRGNPPGRATRRRTRATPWTDVRRLRRAPTIAPSVGSASTTAARTGAPRRPAQRSTCSRASKRFASPDLAGASPFQPAGDSGAAAVGALYKLSIR